jgi:hypothetical protein
MDFAFHVDGTGGDTWRLDQGGWNGRKTTNVDFALIRREVSAGVIGRFGLPFTEAVHDKLAGLANVAERVFFGEIGVQDNGEHDHGGVGTYGVKVTKGGQIGLLGSGVHGGDKSNGARNNGGNHQAVNVIGVEFVNG